MKLLDVIKNRKCKVCDSSCKIKVMGKASTSTIGPARKSMEAGVTTEFGIDEDSIFIKKTIPTFNIIVLESYVSLTDEKYHIVSSIQNVPIINKFIIGLVVSCDARHFEDHVNDLSKQDKQMSPKQQSYYQSEDAADEADYKSHYEDTYGISIDTSSKDNTIKVVRVQERMEDEEYSITKTFGNSPHTRIARKPKSISLSFLYDKDIKDLEFKKILEMTKLLK